MILRIDGVASGKYARAKMGIERRGLDFSFFHIYNITHTKKAVKETVGRQERRRDPVAVGSRDE